MTVTLRETTKSGARSHVLITMAKPGAGETLDGYLAAVPRDRPDAAPLTAV